MAYRGQFTVRPPGSEYDRYGGGGGGYSGDYEHDTSYSHSFPQPRPPPPHQRPRQHRVEATVWEDNQAQYRQSRDPHRDFEQTRVRWIPCLLCVRACVATMGADMRTPCVCVWLVWHAGTQC